MNPMYDCSGRLDRFGGVTEPPDDYYFSYRESDDSCKVSTPASNPNMAAELAAAKAKCEMLQIMYESLLNRVLAGKAG